MEQTKKGSVLSSLIVGLKLLLICTVIAGVVSFFYALTLDTYEKNLQETRNRAVGSIYGGDTLTCVTYEALDGATVYQVLESDAVIGYCVEVNSPGFGGDVAVMVGYNADMTVRGVSIISHSETPGLGARVTESGFLSQFEGKGGKVVLGDDVDAISGATISSRAVTDGVNLATEILTKVLQTKGGAA